MLRVQTSLRSLRLLPRSIVLSRSLSAQKSDEIVVSEVKNLTNVALKLYNRRDLEAQIVFLKDLREEKINKKLIVDGFIEKSPSLAYTWLPMWISKAVVLEDPKDHVKLFPVAAPVDNIELASTVKMDLTNLLVNIRDGHSTEDSYSQAVDHIEALAHKMNIDHLRDTTIVMHNFFNGKIVPSALYSELLEKGGLYADAIAPILKFVQLEVPTADQTRFLALEQSRIALHDQLVEELTHLLHVVYRNRFHEESSRGASEEEMDLLVVPHAQKAAYLMREARIVKVFAERESYDYHIEHPSDGGMVYVRAESQNTGKIRFGDAHVLSVKAPCYARKKESDETGIYNDFNSMLAEGKSKSTSSTKSPKKAKTLKAGQEDPEAEQDLWRRKVVIDNLPPNITAVELRHALRKCGPVAKVWLYRDERTTPDEVRHMHAHQSALKVKARSTGCDPDEPELVEPEVEVPAISNWTPVADDGAESPAVSGQEAAVHAAEQQRLPTKHKMLRGMVKTDSYAFVQMADEEGFQKITKDAVRLFGIQIQSNSCRVLMAQTYKSFWIDVGQNHSVQEAIYSLNEMFDGQFECYSDKEYERLRPVYLQMTFEDAVECQRAFDLLLRRMEAMQDSGLAFERRQWERHGRKWEHIRANLYPSWIKDSWYKEQFDRHSKYIEKKEAGRKLQAEHNAAARMAAQAQVDEEAGSQHAATASKEDQSGSSDSKPLRVKKSVVKTKSANVATSTNAGAVDSKKGEKIEKKGKPSKASPADASTVVSKKGAEKVAKKGRSAVKQSVSASSK